MRTTRKIITIIQILCICFYSIHAFNGTLSFFGAMVFGALSMHLIDTILDL